MGAGRTLSGLALAAIWLAVPSHALGAAGDLDPSFGTNGSFIQAFGPASSNVRAATVQPDGKIVGAGWSQQSGTDPRNRDFELLRLNANGTIDTTFGGGDGVVTTPISAAPQDDTANAVALGPGGTIYAAGGTDPVGTDLSDIAVARYDSSGTLDPDFGGGDGIVVIPQPNINSATAIQVQGDGKPVIAGSGPFVADSDWLIARFKMDGDLDPTFNPAGSTPGVNTTSFTSFGDGPSALQILGDGRLLTAGASNFGGDIALAQYTSVGVLDTAGFGAGTGKATLALPEAQTANALAIDASGRPVVAGEQMNTTGSFFRDFLVARFNANGSPDAAFSGDGVQTTSFVAGDGTRVAKATGVAIQADGRILAAGDAFINCPGLGCADLALARYGDNGELDPEFAGDGTKTLGIGADNDFAYALVLQTTPSARPSRGPGEVRAVVAGESGNSDDTVDRNSAAGVQLTGAGATSTCRILRAEKKVRFANGPLTYKPTITAHEHNELAFTVSVFVDEPGCQVTISETLESQQNFDFFGETSKMVAATTADNGEEAFTGFRTSRSRFTGTRKNQIRAEVASGEVAFAEAEVTIYDNGSEIQDATGGGVSGRADEGNGGGPGADPPPIETVDISLLLIDKALEEFTEAPPPPFTEDPVMKAKRCQWLTKKGGFKRVKPTDGVCDHPVWIKAKLGKPKRGKRPFSYEFKDELPPGKYIAYARSTNRAGVTEPRFTKKIGNAKKFVVKR